KLNHARSGISFVAHQIAAVFKHSLISERRATSTDTAARWVLVDSPVAEFSQNCSSICQTKISATHSVDVLLRQDSLRKDVRVLPEKILKYNVAITKRFCVSNETRASLLRPLDDQLKVQVCLADLIAVIARRHRHRYWYWNTVFCSKLVSLLLVVELEPAWQIGNQQPYPAS